MCKLGPHFHISVGRLFRRGFSFTASHDREGPTSLQSDKTREGCFRSGPLEKPFTDYGELSVFCQSAGVVLIPVPGNHQSCFTAEDKRTLSVILGSLWVECGRQVVDVLRYCSEETRDKCFGKITCQPEIPIKCLLEKH